MMKKNNAVLTTIVLLFLSLPSPSISIRCNPNDKKALLQIKYSFNNPDNFHSWTIIKDCCDWYGIKCDLTTNRVITLALFSGNLSGNIPTAVANLPYLQTLILRKLPYLTGPIPPAIAKLSHLTMLRLSWNNLTGPVPSFLSQLKNLFLLDLAFNHLTGTIPPELSELTNLGGIFLDRNRLTGAIPPSFGKFSGSVPDLYLSHNMLTGEVPRSLGALNFTTIDFSRNQLVGDVSFLFGTNKSIQIIDLSRNEFAFDISKVVFPASLTALDLNHNKITGSLPAGLTALNFQLVNVSYNQLCGQIPTGGKLQDFDYTCYFHNKCLCGAPLPACK